MNNEWIQEEMNELRKLFVRCKGEDALMADIICVMRLLNGVSQLCKTEFHKYEKKILANPMKLFVRYFIEQVEEALEQEDMNEKGIEVADIEDAVCKMSDIYESVTNYTTHTDRQVFMSLPMDTGLYEVSPKYYALYAELLDNLIKIFDAEDRKYAFVLYPTLLSTVQTEPLFGRRRKSGKVIVISISVRMLEDTVHTSIYLVHEAFHTLTKEERSRKLRAKFLLQNLLNQIGECLFEGVHFASKGGKICDILLRRWFADTRESFRKLYESKSKGDWAYYGDEICRWLKEWVEIDLRKIDVSLETDFEESVCQSGIYQSIEDNFEQYSKVVGSLMEQIPIIRDNVYFMLRHDLTNYYLERLLFLYREAYSDVSCLLTMGYEEKYEEAFRESVQFAMKDEDYMEDDYRIIRQILVKCILKSEEKPRLEMVRREIEDGIKLRKGTGEQNEMTKKRGHSDEKGLKRVTKRVIMTERLLESYVSYLWQCRTNIEDALKLEASREEIKKFQKKIKALMENNPDMEKELLIGRWEERFDS